MMESDTPVPHPRYRICDKCGHMKEGVVARFVGPESPPILECEDCRGPRH